MVMALMASPKIQKAIPIKSMARWDVIEISV
jgi:hypothetical protein